MTKVSDQSPNQGSVASRTNGSTGNPEQTALFEKSLGKVAGAVQSSSLVQSLSRRLHAQDSKPVAVYALRFAMTRDEIESDGATDSDDQKITRNAAAEVLRRSDSKANGVAVVDVSGAPTTFEIEKIDDLLFVDGTYFDRICQKAIR